MKDDYIMRSAALDVTELSNLSQYFDSVQDGEDKRIRRAVIRAIANIPPTDAQPVVVAHWYWDENGMDWGIGAWKCSNCRTKAETWWAAGRGYNPYRCSGGHYCGNCGADMRPEPPKEAET